MKKDSESKRPDRKKEYAVAILLNSIIIVPIIVIVYFLRNIIGDIVRALYLLMKTHYLFPVGILCLLIVGIVKWYLDKKKLAQLPEKHVRDIKNETIRTGGLVKLTCRLREMYVASWSSRGSAEYSAESPALSTSGGTVSPSMGLRVSAASPQSLS
jgi:hypothetical protein